MTLPLGATYGQCTVLLLPVTLVVCFIKVNSINICRNFYFVIIFCYKKFIKCFINKSFNSITILATMLYGILLLLACLALYRVIIILFKYAFLTSFCFCFRSLFVFIFLLILLFGLCFRTIASLFLRKYIILVCLYTIST